MVESGLLTQTLCILNLPSPQQEQWQADLVEAAQRAGWTILFNSPDQSALPETNQIVFYENFVEGVCEVSDWVILADQTAPTALYQAEQFGVSVFDANRSISRRYAHANVPADLGVRVLMSDAGTLDLPGLGMVSRGGRASRALEYRGALAFYDQLPLRPGACANWTKADFLGPLSEAAGALDLTGRRRLLQHGPYFDMAPGTWRITLGFILDAGTAMTDLRFEWGTAEDTVSAGHSINRPGVYEISLVRDWTAVAPAELRIWLDRSMFDGSLQFESCKVCFEAPLRGVDD